MHPEALAVFAGLVRSASTRMQIILATQSPVLLSEFEPEQIITVDQKDGASIFRRLDATKLVEWLDEYTLRELWQNGYQIRGSISPVDTMGVADPTRTGKGRSRGQKRAVLLLLHGFKLRWRATQIA